MTFSQGRARYVANYDRLFRKENNMKNSMGHFTGWKFGVPVKVYAKSLAEYSYDSVITSEEVRLIAEDDSTFTMIFYYKKQTGCAVRLKQDYYYELIPHKICGAFSPRYPVCQNSKRVAYCNSSMGEPQMAQIDSNSVRNLKLYPIATATFTIDGKTIELSAETTAELKKKLGI